MASNNFKLKLKYRETEEGADLVRLIESWIMERNEASGKLIDAEAYLQRVQKTFKTHTNAKQDNAWQWGRAVELARQQKKEAEERVSNAKTEVDHYNKEFATKFAAWKALNEDYVGQLVSSNGAGSGRKSRKNRNKKRKTRHRN
jgi:hypothetical protein